MIPLISPSRNRRATSSGHIVAALALLATVTAVPRLQATESAASPANSREKADPAIPAYDKAIGRTFHLSADHGTTADHARDPETAQPTFESEITVIPDGARGPALRCGNLQRLAWRAPGHVFAQRGTISFFWRAHTPVGPTEFPIFRVGFSDHSSWDMVFLRLDYNGRGFDAFVTDTGLARIRVSATIDPFPRPDEWVHLAFAWDETVGVRLYVNGQLVASKDQRALLDAGLDQFGPHSRIISPHQVQSDYNFVRGGDLDELSIFDHLLDDDAIAALARFEALPLHLDYPSLDEPATRAAWLWRYGWNRPDAMPPPLPAKFTRVRKVEIHEAFDLKRWWWKANDGIRETTWPGVYNRSRIPGRHDYFELPDWDCYVESGKSITFTLPAEPWNHLEVTGPAWGTFSRGLVGAELASTDPTAHFERARGQEKTVHRLEHDAPGGTLRFTNAEPETPIAELAAYHVSEGREPAATRTLELFASRGSQILDASTEPVLNFKNGRHPPEESTTATLWDTKPAAVSSNRGPKLLPILHCIVPGSRRDLARDDEALDGIALDLPPLSGDAPVALNVRVKDPLWPARDLADFSFTVPPRAPHTLWFDLRDRILPPGKSLYLTIAASAPAVHPADLAVTARLHFEPREAGRAEHELDRFTQARDAYAMLVEEHPYGPKLDLWVRFENDLKDLLRVNPQHALGLKYAAVAFRDHPRPAYTPPAAPPGVPRWAFLQTELVKRVDRFVNWYIDRRQETFGDFGGGISDDSDFLNLWPAAAALGIDPEKLRASNSRLLEASFANGMWANGLSAIQTDELHSYEEGINILGQMLILFPGSPRELERAMETARSLEQLTAINHAGHRHIRSSYFSGTKFATDGVWGWAKAYSHLALQPAQLLVDFNGMPRTKQLLIEVADGLLAHRKPAGDGRHELPSAIEFATDAEARATRNWFPWPVFWNAWQWTQDRRYLDPIFDGGVPTITSLNPNVLDQLALRPDWGPRIERGEAGRAQDGRPGSRSIRYRGASGFGHFQWQLTGDKQYLETLYTAQLEETELTGYINTEGSLWIDRVGIPNLELQRARLGGVALVRNSPFPGHAVSWSFAAPARADSVALLIPDATRTSFTVYAHNLSTQPVVATMTGAHLDRGEWSLAQEVETTGGNETATRAPAREPRRVRFGRTESLDLTLPPGVTTILKLKLERPGTPYWETPDLGLDPHDVVIENDGRTLKIRVHSLGSVPAPKSTLVVRDANGRVGATSPIPPLEAPVDLRARTVEVLAKVPGEFRLRGATVELNPGAAFEEITRANNRVQLAP